MATQPTGTLQATPRPSSEMASDILFGTPRRRKTPQTPTPKPKTSRPWPRCRHVVTSAHVAAETEHIFGFPPREEQLKAGIKPLEGNDVIIVARTGAGKSLIFAITAIAAALAGFEGVIIVICPLKSLQLDQVSKLSHRSSTTT